MKDTKNIPFSNIEILFEKFLPKTFKKEGGLRADNVGPLWSKYGETILVHKNFKEHKPETNVQAAVYGRLYKIAKKSGVTPNFEREDLVLPMYCSETGQELLYWEKPGHPNYPKTYLTNGDTIPTLDNIRYISKTGAQIKGIVGPSKQKKVSAPKPVVDTTQLRKKNLENMLNSIDAKKAKGVAPQVTSTTTLATTSAVKATTPATAKPQVKATTPAAAPDASKLTLFSVFENIIEIVTTEMPVMAETMRNHDIFTPEIMNEFNDFISKRM